MEKSNRLRRRTSASPTLAPTLGVQPASHDELLRRTSCNFLEKNVGVGPGVSDALTDAGSFLLFFVLFSSFLQSRLLKLITNYQFIILLSLVTFKPTYNYFMFHIKYRSRLLKTSNISIPINWLKLHFRKLVITPNQILRPANRSASLGQQKRDGKQNGTLTFLLVDGRQPLLRPFKIPSPVAKTSSNPRQPTGKNSGDLAAFSGGYGSNNTSFSASSSSSPTLSRCCVSSLAAASLHVFKSTHTHNTYLATHRNKKVLTDGCA